jgi:hypothetical protein
VSLVVYDVTRALPIGTRSLVSGSHFSCSYGSDSALSLAPRSQEAYGGDDEDYDNGGQQTQARCSHDAEAAKDAGKQRCVCISVRPSTSCVAKPITNNLVTVKTCLHRNLSRRRTSASSSCLACCQEIYCACVQCGKNALLTGLCIIMTHSEIIK